MQDQGELTEWAKLGLLPPGRGGRDVTVRQMKDLQILNVHHATVALEKEMCSQVKHWSAHHDYVPRPMSNGQKNFLAIYSGHRRFGDIASHFQWDGNIQPICLGVAMHDQFGDALHHNGWLDLIKSRRVIGDSCRSAL